MTINNRTKWILHIVWATVKSFYAFTHFTGKLDAPWIWYVSFWVMFICFDDRQFLHLRCDPTRYPWFWMFFDQQTNRTVNLSKVHQIDKNHLKASKYFGIFYQPTHRIPYIHRLVPLKTVVPEICHWLWRGSCWSSDFGVLAVLDGAFGG